VSSPEFASVLVANRGAIARRVIRSAREMGLRCVAVFVDADEGAPFVREADEAVRISSGYLNGSAIIDAALATDSGAIHPGYGFLSENATFARDVLAAGLVWVGPPPTIIETMGDKLAAKDVARLAQVPTLPFSADLSEMNSVGFPILVKAAAGGGGKGMRIVEEGDSLDEAIFEAQREAERSFDDDRVFLERFVRRSRHIEIQILGDSHGNLVHLGERECSIQRRHQKIIEETPSIGLSESTREALCSAALVLGRAINYQSAGTVEFLFDADSGEFYFLELNARLQVEHAVTEQVTGIDLVREQLRIAAGEAIAFAQEDIHVDGHAIEVRLYAEDVGAGFLPATGSLAAFEPGQSPSVRWEAGVAVGATIGVEFDPMIAKVIAHRSTRHEASRALALALERLHIGGIVTNRVFLVNTLRHAAFSNGDTTTDLIDRVEIAHVLEMDSHEMDLVCMTAALWLQGCNREESTVLRELPSGWRNAMLPMQHVTLLTREANVHEVRYHTKRDGSFEFDSGNTGIVHSWSPTEVDLEIDGRRQRSRITRARDKVLVQTTRGTVELDIVPRFPVPAVAAPTGSVAAPMPGTVIEIRIAVGDRVRDGQPMVILEAMKMEHRVVAPLEGVVREVRIALGQHVETGAVLLVIDESEEATTVVLSQ
jgi:propionyl-CoA carboxylase alpha chain